MSFNNARRQFTKLVFVRHGHLYKNVLANAPPKDYKVFQITKPVGLDKIPKQGTYYDHPTNILSMFNSKKTELRSKELEKEFTHGGFYNLHTFKQTNGKLFNAPTQIFSQKEAKFFPHLKTKVIKGEKKESVAQVIGLFGTDPAYSFVGKWFDQVPANTLPKVAINLVRGRIPLLIVNAFGRWKLKKDARSWDRYELGNRRQWPYSLWDNIKLSNEYTGYILVLDKYNKIRWLASGEPTSKEILLFKDACEVVSKE